MVFHFEIAKNPVLKTAAEIKEIQRRWNHVVEQHGWITQYLSNHDTPRQVSWFGNDTTYRYQSATMLALLLHTHPGTVYIYQGEEIGMTNVDFPSIEYYNEKYTVGKYHTMVESGTDPAAALDSLKKTSRDNDRTPMQWNGAPHGGFTTGTPWMHVNPNYPQINVEQEEQAEQSVLRFYRTLTGLRKAHPVMVYGTYRQLLEDDPDLIVYKREYESETWLVLCNFYDREHPLPQAVKEELAKGNHRLVLANYPDAGEVLRPYEARIYSY